LLKAPLRLQDFLLHFSPAKSVGVSPKLSDQLRTYRKAIVGRSGGQMAESGVPIQLPILAANLVSPQSPMDIKAHRRNSASLLV
jgi:hypothetical protein